MHRATSLPATAIVKGHLVTTPPQTFIDMASRLGHVELVALSDQLVRRTHSRPADLVTAARHVLGQRGRAARAAAILVREQVDSIQETCLRLLLVEAGLPEPVINHVLRDQHGKVRRRIDLSYPDLMIAIEYDGRHHINRRDQWTSDITRREELEGEGWRMIVVTADDLRDPNAVVTRVRQAVADRSPWAGRTKPATRHTASGAEGSTKSPSAPPR